MAWRPSEYLLEGELDNTQPGKVTGWMRFAGMNERIVFDLEGNFHRDIRGAKIRFTGNGNEHDPKAAGYMDGMSTEQTGEVGDITAGLPPADYVKYPYIEVVQRAEWPCRSRTGSRSARSHRPADPGLRVRSDLAPGSAAQDGPVHRRHQRSGRRDCGRTRHGYRRRPSIQPLGR
jgi:hypothetical protein